MQDNSEKFGAFRNRTANLENTVEGSEQNFRPFVLFRPDQQSALLESYLKNRHPSTPEKRQLAAQLDLSLKQVQGWFYNRRTRPARRSLLYFSESHLRLLFQLFKETPHPTRDELEALSKEMGMPFRKVYDWFTKQRSAQNLAVKKLHATREQLTALNKLYMLDKTPSLEKRQEYAARINLSLDFVTNWFVRKRRKASDQGRNERFSSNVFCRLFQGQRQKSGMVKASTRYTEKQIQLLKQAFSESQYLSSQKAMDLAMNAGLSVKQVCGWFSDKRKVLGVRVAAQHANPEQQYKLHEAFLGDPSPTVSLRRELATKLSLSFYQVERFFHSYRDIYSVKYAKKQFFSLDQLSILNEEFKINKYLTREGYLRLATEMGVPLIKIREWFKRQRLSHLKKKRREAAKTAQ